MKNQNTIYAAYGSNMNLEQMRFRCPYARVLGNGELQDYSLVFRGVATVEPEKGASVPILLWNITPRDEEALDRYEGWPHFYRKETVKVRVGKRKKVEAMIYIMNDGHPVERPNRRYYETIAKGYAAAGFDTAVLEKAVKDATEQE